MKQQSKEIPPFAFDESSDLPLWVQLRNRMVYLITSGFYKPGEKLPTVRKYAADLRIAYNTVNKAYMGLERDGYVTAVRGSGVFVNDSNAIMKPAPEVDALVEEFVRGCLENGMAYDDIPKMVSSCIRRMKKENEQNQR
ncbi:GntR family transcriptional regulator [uncultured Ellagibacter sp.]|uniref:GntR family transcriptional regulator n=1 Tax=uncultured Ellagibacter sp. TaxID=2137580 RepID=UPI00261171CE|nr:GntR family transcriptional regulator [uncultured Ellagibacter sp.]